MREGGREREREETEKERGVRESEWVAMKKVFLSQCQKKVRLDGVYVVLV